MTNNCIKLSLLSFLLVIFCIKCNKHINTSSYTPETIHKLISINKSSCFGKCPVYKLTIYNDGLMILEAKNNLDKLGVFHQNLSPAQIGEIKIKIDKLDFSDSKNRYMKNIPDLPVTTLDFFIKDSLYRRIESNSSMPKSLEDLQSELSQLYSLKNWNLAIKEKDLNSKDAIKNELQIDMDTAFHYLHLENIFKAYHLKMQNRISEYMNYYLFSYDSNKISPAEMVVLLRRIKGVRLVTFNKKLQPREEF